MIIAVKGLIEWYTNLSPFWQKFAMGALIVVTALGPLLVLIGKFLIMLPALKAGIAIISGLFGAATLPILGVVAAIAAVALAAYLIYKNWDKIFDFMVGVWEGLKNIIASAVNWIKDFLSKWGVEVLAVIAPFIGIPLLIRKHWDTIKEFFTGIWNWLKSFFAKWGVEILAVLVPFIGIPLLIRKNSDTIKTFFAELWQTIGNKISCIRFWMNEIQQLSIPI